MVVRPAWTRRPISIWPVVRPRYPCSTALTKSSSRMIISHARSPTWRPSPLANASAKCNRRPISLPSLARLSAAFIRSGFPSSWTGRSAKAGLKCEFEAIISGNYFHFVPVAADFLQTDVFAEHRFDHAVVISRLVMKHDEPLDRGLLCQLDRNDIARVPPILSDRNRIGKRIHRVKNKKVSIPIECHKGIRVVESRIFVLAIGRIHDRLAISFEPIAVRIAGMKLLD